MIEIGLDAETNILNRGEGAVGTMQASPYAAVNHIVSLGELALPSEGEPRYRALYDASGVKGVPAVLSMAMKGRKVRMIAHNVGFDLSYLMKEWPTEFWEALPNLEVWCTMQGAYLLSGQTKVMPSLDSEAALAGLPLKDDRIKSYWQQGIDTAHIPKDELLDYMETDVRNTVALYHNQVERMQNYPGMYELAVVKMKDIMMTTIMSYNGMRFSLERAAEAVDELDKELEKLYTALIEMAAPHFPPGFDFNPSSPKQVSSLLFGGSYDVIEDTVVLGPDNLPVLFKGGARKGQVKTRKEKRTYETKGFKLKSKGIPHGPLGFSTADEHLANLSHPFTDLMRRHRELEKDAETYYRGYSALVWPDGCIRPSYNNEIAATGRQTCSKPNLQNVSKGEG